MATNNWSDGERFVLALIAWISWHIFCWQVSADSFWSCTGLSKTSPEAGPAIWLAPSVVRILDDKTDKLKWTQERGEKNIKKSWPFNLDCTFCGEYLGWQNWQIKMNTRSGDKNKIKNEAGPAIWIAPSVVSILDPVILSLNTCSLTLINCANCLIPAVFFKKICFLSSLIVLTLSWAWTTLPVEFLVTVPMGWRLWLKSKLSALLKIHLLTKKVWISISVAESLLFACRLKFLSWYMSIFSR